MRILGVDQAKQKFGVGMLNLCEVTGFIQVLYSDTIKIPSKFDIHDSSNYLFRWLTNYREKINGFEVLVFEEIYQGKGGAPNYKKLCYAQAACSLFASINNMERQIYCPTTARAKFGIKGKESTRDLMISMYPSIKNRGNRVSSLLDDETDALLLATYYATLKREELFK